MGKDFVFSITLTEWGLGIGWDLSLVLALLGEIHFPQIVSSPELFLDFLLSARTLSRSDLSQQRTILISS